MPSLPSLEFDDLVLSRFSKALPASESLEQSVRGEDETDFDLRLWAIANRLNLDSEELLRQLGEEWLKVSAGSGVSGAAFFDGLVALVFTERQWEDAPIAGMEGFEVELLSRTTTSVSLTCRGPRRCCSFLEGVVRGFASGNGVAIRYQRRPRSAMVTDLRFSQIVAA